MTTELENPNLFGVTIFCDDIRFEHDGKVSFIGVYDQMMVHAPFPVTLPKLGFGITVWQRMDFYKPVEKVRILLPDVKDDEPGLTMAVAADANSAPDPSETTDLGYMAMRANVVLNPVILAGPGSIRIRVHMDGQVFKAGTLRVSAAPREPRRSQP